MKPLGYSLDEMLTLMRTIEGRPEFGNRLELHLSMADEFIDLLTQRAAELTERQP